MRAVFLSPSLVFPQFTFHVVQRLCPNLSCFFISQQTACCGLQVLCPSVREKATHHSYCPTFLCPGAVGVSGSATTIRMFLLAAWLQTCFIHLMIVHAWLLLPTVENQTTSSTALLFTNLKVVWIFGVNDIMMKRKRKKGGRMRKRNSITIWSATTFWHNVIKSYTMWCPVSCSCKLSGFFL